MITSKEERQKFDEIEQNAIDCYLDKTDFDISEWVAKEDFQFWRKFLSIELGQCPTCGEEEAEKCKCE